MELNKYLFDNFPSSFFLNEKTEDNLSVISELNFEKSIINFGGFYSISDFKENEKGFPSIKVTFEKDKTKYESNNKSKKETPIFTTILRNKKRGRPNMHNRKRKEHCSSSFDNIISKIQTHYLNFLISFINDAIKSYFKQQKFEFLKLGHKEKSKVSFEYLNKLKNSSLEDILNMMNISDKYKYDKDTNKNNIKKLSRYTFFEKLFKIKFLLLFYYYYNDKQPLKEIWLFSEKITLSEKTKSFYGLLQKYERFKKDIIEVTDAFYINEFNSVKSTF